MTNIDHSRPVTVILGCGYVGSRLARALLADGFPVRACARNIERLQPLASLGAELVSIDASRPKQFGPALRGTKNPLVVYAIPPPPGLPGGEVLRRATQAALGVAAQSFIYLSTSGVYGNAPDDEWVDENTPISLGDQAMSARYADESSVEAATSAGMHTVILRLAAIYGPARGMRQRIKKGELKLIDGGKHYNSRIHVDDLVTIIRVAGTKAPAGALYLVADDRPTTQQEYAAWLCQRMGASLPASVDSLAPGARRVPLRGRRLRNDKMKHELGIVLRYPTFIEGEAQIEREEGGALEPASPAPESLDDSSPNITAAPAQMEAPAATHDLPSSPARQRPLNIRHYSNLGNDAGMRYSGVKELFAARTDLARPLGLRHLDAHHELLEPGQRTCCPHAHSEQEELTFVLDGTPEVWIDGELYALSPGDVVTFPAGTGIAHAIINNSTAPVSLLVVNDQQRANDRLRYPLNHECEKLLPNERRWTDAPPHTMGPHSAAAKKD